MSRTPVLTLVYDGHDHKPHYRDVYGDEALLGLRCKTIIVRIDHPFLYQKYADQWLENVRCRLEPDGQWIEVTSERG